MEKKIKYYSITYGHIVASWHILFLVKKYNNISIKDAVSIVSKSGKLGGTVPVKQGLKICVDYNLIKINEEKLHITKISEDTIIMKCDDEDPNIDVIRALLFHILSYNNFEWLILYDSDPEIFRQSLKSYDQEWAFLLENAKLFNFHEDSVYEWWNNILSKYENYKNELKKAIGEVGEKLAYIHEIGRITADGFSQPKSYVKWASRISDRFGFDIQSIRGNFFLSTFEENEKIQIEVKSSDSDYIERFRFYISRPEWNVALDNINSYFFFCWSGINLDAESASSGPFVIPAIDLVSHMPTDNSETLQWSECRCVIDLSKYPIPKTK